MSCAAALASSESADFRWLSNGPTLGTLYDILASEISGDMISDSFINDFYIVF